MCGAGHCLYEARPVGIEFKTRVGATHTIEFAIAGKFAIGVDRADTGLAQNVTADASDEKCRAVAGYRIVIGNTLSWTTIVYRKKADGIRAGLSRKPCAKLRITDTAGEEQIDRCLKVIGILQEKRTLLREKYFEPLIDRDLRFVGFDLTEVRICRGIEHEVVMENKLRIESSAKQIGRASYRER